MLQTGKVVMVDNQKRTIIGTPIISNYQDIIDVNVAWANQIPRLVRLGVQVFELDFEVDPTQFKHLYLSKYPQEIAKQYDCRTCLALLYRLAKYFYLDKDGVLTSVFFDPAIFDKDTPMQLFSEQITADGRTFFGLTALQGIRSKMVNVPEYKDELDFKLFYEHTFHHFSLCRVNVSEMDALFNRRRSRTVIEQLNLVSRTVDAFNDEVLERGVKLLGSIMEREDFFLKSLERYREFYPKLGTGPYCLALVADILNADADTIKALEQVNNGAVSHLLKILAGDGDDMTALAAFGKITNSLVYGKKIADAGNQLIKEAADVFKERGVVPALHRRLARFEEIPADAFTWKTKVTADDKSSDDPILGLMKQDKKHEPVCTVYDNPKRVTSAQLIEQIKFADRVFMRFDSGVGREYPYGFIHRPIAEDTAIIHNYDKPEKRNVFSGVLPSAIDQANPALNRFLRGDLFLKTGDPLIEIRAVSPSVNRWFEEPEEEQLYLFYPKDADIAPAGTAFSYHHACNVPALLPELKKYVRVIEQYSREGACKTVSDPGNDCLTMTICAETVIEQGVSFYLQKGDVRQRYIVAIW